MKKIILIGRSEAGKTTLIQALKGENIQYHKTQYVNHFDVLIDTPGEYIESKMDFEKIQKFAEISFDAGKFVCNNLYFHLLKYDDSRTLFIHVPECNNDAEKYKLYAEKISRIIEAL